MAFLEAPESVEQIEKIAQHITQPKLINMFYGGKTPLVPMKKLQDLGYSIVIIPSDLQRAVIYTMGTVLSTIKNNGDSSAIKDQLATFNERETIVGTDDYLQLDAKFNKASD